MNCSWDLARHLARYILFYTFLHQFGMVSSRTRKVHYVVEPDTVEPHYNNPARGLRFIDNFAGKVKKYMNFIQDFIIFGFIIIYIFDTFRL